MRPTIGSMVKSRNAPRKTKSRTAFNASDLRLESDRTRDAGPAEPAVSVRVLREVLLVIVLGVIERARVEDLGGNRVVALLLQRDVVRGLRRERGRLLL